MSSFPGLNTYHKGSIYVKVTDGKVWEIKPCTGHDITGYCIVGSPYEDDKWLPCVDSARRRVIRRWGVVEG